MADGSNPAFALAIAQAIARGQGTPQQRSAFNSAVAQQMQANAAAQAALHGQQAPPGAGGFQPHPIGPEFPGGHPQMPPPQQPYPGSVPAPPGYTGPVGVGNTILPTGGAGLAPAGSALGATTPSPVHPVPYAPLPGHPVHPGGGFQGVNPGGPMQQAPQPGVFPHPPQPGGHPIKVPVSTRPGGPVRPIGPAWPQRPGGGAHWYGPGGTGVFRPL